MNRTDLMMARMKKGWDNEDLARELGIKKKQVESWERYDHVPENYEAAVKRACGIVEIKQKKHPAVRTSSGVRFGWDERS